MPVNDTPNGSYLNTSQVSYLVRPVDPNRVFETQGQSNMAAYEIKAHLNRIFGFGRWSAEVIGMELIYEQPTTTRQGKQAYNVAYRAGMRLQVCSPSGRLLATYTEWAVGDATMPDFKRADAHDMAVKTAESQALKRCAINLGDQFGLSLYAKGSLAPLVRGTFVGLPEPEVPTEHDKVVEDVDPDHAADVAAAAEAASAPPAAQEKPQGTAPQQQDWQTMVGRVQALPADAQRAVFAQMKDAGFPEIPSEFTGEQIASTFQWIAEVEAAL